MSVNVQIATDRDATPGADDIIEWADCALALGPEAMEMTVRVVGLDEGRRLNERWRRGTGPTNVLAFPVEGLRVEPGLLGDVVVCAPVANAEARHGGKSVHAHWAHLVIHGTLHLLGHDHLDDADAQRMEEVERTLLQKLGYPDPYL
jgi:probable rRNA maturation factor